MKKLARKKLRLQRDVVRVLNRELAGVAGALVTYSNYTECCPDTFPPCSDMKSGCGSFSDV
jgi:hypothetical protein